jgi:hypothetical protein
VQFYMNEHMTVEKVVDGVAIVTVRVPLEVLDDVMALADYAIHASRWISRRSRCGNFAAHPSKFMRVHK